MNVESAQRLFDLGVAIALVSLSGVALYIAWHSGWKAYEKYIIKPRLEKEEQARLKKEKEDAERAGETAALEVLAGAGYEFEARNQQAQIPVTVDGKEEAYEVVADLIVKKGDSKYVAEVKHGRVATSLRSGALRRQLLEYSLAYSIAGVLLVNMKTRTVHLVNFLNYKVDPKPTLDRQAILVTLITGIVIGAGATVLFARVIFPYVDPIP